MNDSISSDPMLEFLCLAGGLTLWFPISDCKWSKNLLIGLRTIFAMFMLLGLSL